MNSLLTPPKVSVVIVAYNQETHIVRCVESVLTQDVDFEMEVIVADDCSTDRTPKLLRSLAEQHPDRLKLFLQDPNIGAFANYRFVHRQARGDYVAHLDGDDYLLPGKLAKQCAFLDKNPDCPLVAHRMAIANSGRKTSSTLGGPERISLTYLLLNHPIFLNSSMMYRRDKLQSLFEIDKDIIDFYVYVAAAKLGDIGFINERLGVYNANIGISSGKKLLPYIDEAIEFADKSASDAIKNKARYRQSLRYAYAALRRRDDDTFRELIRKTSRHAKKISIGSVLFYLRRSPSFLRIIVGFAELPRHVFSAVKRLGQ